MDYEQDFSKLLKPLYISLENLKTVENSYTKLKCKENETKKESLKPTNNNQTSKFLQKSKHVKKDSHCKKNFVCSHLDCRKSFGKHSRLVVHERTHTGDRPFICDFENCDKSYTRQFHLTRHIAISHSVAPVTSKENYRCEKCEKSFSNPYSLKKHENKIHKHKKYTCDECGQLFHKQQHLKTHSYVHTGIKPYSCEYRGCERRFDIPSRLKRHYSLFHVKGRYLCPYDNCPEKHDSYTELRAHLTIGHPKICDVCGKEFTLLSRLKTHLATHTSIREAFFCPFTPCERYYFEERNLRNHICCKHNENFKGFTCRVCDKSLVTKQKLKLHVLSHEPNKVVKSKTPKPRKPRKDKGVSRTDFAMLLSGYSPNDVEARAEIGGGDGEGNLSLLA